MSEESSDQKVSNGGGREPDKPRNLIASAAAEVKRVMDRWALTTRLAFILTFGLALMGIGKFIGSQNPIPYLFTLSATVAAMVFFLGMVIDHMVIDRLRWAVRTVEWHTRALDYLRSQSALEVKLPDQIQTAWPWGTHHTDMLGHLEAAARKWWAFYDPSQPDTAPTNDIVASWLHEERNVSKDKARAIASILRADGLRTGPRGS